MNCEMRLKIGYSIQPCCVDSDKRHRRQWTFAAHILITQHLAQLYSLGGGAKRILLFKI